MRKEWVIKNKNKTNRVKEKFIGRGRITRAKDKTRFDG
jgi:hypothetical protein